MLAHPLQVIGARALVYHAKVVKTLFLAVTISFNVDVNTLEY